MRKAFLALGLALALGSSLPAQADEASHRKAVIELFNAMKMEQLMQQAIDAMLAAQLQANPQLVSLEPKMRQFFAKHMSWQALKDDYVVLYTQTFTEQEIVQLAAFYKTPVGRKSLEKMPVLMQRGAEIGADRVRKNMPELMELLGATQAPPSSH